MRKSILNTLLAMAGLLVTQVAHAAPGQTTGSNGTSSTWGTREGNSYASIDLTFNGLGTFNHDAGTRSSIGSMAWTAPSATLLGHKETFWSVISIGTATRDRAAGTANRTTAYGNVQFGGTTYYTCSLDQNATRSSCSNTRSLNKTFAEGDQTYWIAGVIPVSIGGRIWGNVSTSLGATGTLSSLANTGASSHDEGFASVSANGSVSGTAWAFLGIDGVIGVGGSATVNFLRVTASGPYVLSQRNKCVLGGTCTASNRIAYRIDSRAGGTSYDTLSGNIRVEGCLGFCASGTPFSWRGIHLGDWTADPKVLTDQFASSY